MVEANCPSCGAQIEFKQRDSIYAVCSYCSTLVLRKDKNVEDRGKVAALIEDGSPIQLRTKGEYQGKRFEVVGRIQVQTSSGFWNEWFISYENESAWLSESNGQYVVLKLHDERLELPSHKKLTLGDMIEVASDEYFVTDIEDGIVVSGEGELPFEFTCEYKSPSVDLVGENNKFATIDYSEGSPLIYLGEFVDFFDLHFTNLADVYNWKKPIEPPEPQKQAEKASDGK